MSKKYATNFTTPILIQKRGYKIPLKIKADDQITKLEHIKHMPFQRQISQF